eukprot:scaffold39597_cov69-Phaeocystis_antarctica.AAC.3
MQDADVWAPTGRKGRVFNSGHLPPRARVEGGGRGSPGNRRPRIFSKSRFKNTWPEWWPGWPACGTGSREQRARLYPLVQATAPQPDRSAQPPP